MWADSATNIYGFVRFNEGEQILVLLNNQAKPQSVDLTVVAWPVAVPKQVRDLLTDEKFALGEVLLEPYGARILLDGGALRPLVFALEHGYNGTIVRFYDKVSYVNTDQGLG